MRPLQLAADGELVEYARILTWITGNANQELLLRNGYLAAENRMLRAYGPTVVCWTCSAAWSESPPPNLMEVMG